MQQMALREAAMAEEYRNSFRSKTTRSLKWYFTRILLPLLIIVFLAEDFTNMSSPRRNLYKNKLRIPDLRDYLMFEIVSCARQQEKTPDQKAAERKARNDKKKTQFFKEGNQELLAEIQGEEDEIESEDLDMEELEPED
mmetsp:Transcript_15888/g.24468  ORF Transcript_15888/g.24468 Transcript_15888/m.24468 type:complete len:139 (+) Transcript_15888:216-632(+)